MTKYDDVATLIDDLDTTTNTLAASVQKLIDDINRTATDGLNGPQTENVLARLGALSTTLKAIGASADNPIPPAPPAPATMPGPFA